MPRIDRDIGASAILEQGQRVLRRRVIHAEQDDAFHVWPERLWRAASRARLRHIGHVAGIAGIEPGFESLRCFRHSIWPRNAAEIEAEFARLFCHRALQIRLQKSRSAYTGGGVSPGTRSASSARKLLRDFTRAYQCFAVSFSSQGPPPKKSPGEIGAAAARSAVLSLSPESQFRCAVR